MLEVLDGLTDAEVRHITHVRAEPLTVTRQALKPQRWIRL